MMILSKPLENKQPLIRNVLSNKPTLITPRYSLRSGVATLVSGCQSTHRLTGQDLELCVIGGQGNQTTLF